MGRVTIEKMQSVYGTDPGDVVAAIGPSICQDCYEVSEDCDRSIPEEFPGEDQWDQLFYRKENGKYQLNHLEGK